MKISERWLREFTSPAGDTASLVHQLTMQGLEVEGVEAAAPSLPQVVVGRVTQVTPHPNADRLRVCQVDVAGRNVQVVCGAPNVRTGGSYPLALPGATLPGGTTIRAAALRGVDSGGMLCSAAELGLAEAAAAAKSEGLLEIEPAPASGLPITEALALDDNILELKITPNRADCFSVIGVARDLAATTGATFAGIEVPPVVPGDAVEVPVRVEDEAGSPVFMVRAVRGISPTAKSPFWLRERLRRGGIRPIHPVVDITNLVMLELGQPLHAYDLDKLDGGLVVRRARDGEPVNLLTGADIRLDESILVIADAERAIGIAGIMGGSSTAVTASTTNVLFESAFFRPSAIAGRARRLGLQTDAATRFERGVDPTGQRRALERATALLVAIAGGVPAVCQSAGDGMPLPRPIGLRRTRLALVLGHSIPDHEVESIFKRLGMLVDQDNEGWQVHPPPFRFDIGAEVDLIEEVARVYGYDRIPPRAGRQLTELGQASATQISLDLLRAAFVQRGYQEAVTYSFVERDLDGKFAGGDAGVSLVNPISAELAVMRQGLWPGLVQALRHNLARQQSRVRLFEVGVRFVRSGEQLSEELVVSGVASGAALPEQWGEESRTVDYFDVKSDLEAILKLVGELGEFSWLREQHPALHPGRSARLRRREVHLGWVGALHPGLASGTGLPEPPIVFELAANVLLSSTVPRCHELSRFPTVRRDLAIIVARDTPVARLVAATREAVGTVLREVIVFDIFAGEHIEAGQKSVALGLILQETSRTLTDADVDRIVGGVVQRLAKDFSAKLR
jgi:phenylalanyl-tRNA synthetase beta chain